MKEVKQERTGWRDKKISDRHREWGWNCPAVDIDFLLVEYDMNEPKGIVEYKNWATIGNVTGSTVSALKNLSDNAGLPFFSCIYRDDYSVFTVAPKNDLAKKYVKNTVDMSEIEWVRLLYKLRGRCLPSAIENKLMTMSLQKSTVLFNRFKSYGKN